MIGRRSRLGMMALAALGALALAGCERAPNMGQQPRYQPYEQSEFFSDGLSARPLVKGTVGYGWADRDPHLYTGKVDGKPAETMPFKLTLMDLQRGQEQFGVFCSPCHGLAGDGQGMIARRGFTPAPPSLLQDRLVAAPDGHFFEVISNGFGTMYPYDARIEVSDRWRIIAYVRALQLSQHADVTQLPDALRQRIPGAVEWAAPKQGPTQ